MAFDVNAGVRRLRRRFSHLPNWSKVSVLALCAIVVFLSVASAVSASAVHPEEPVATLGSVDDAMSAPSDGEGLETPSSSGETARTALDTASGTAEVNLFEAAGDQRTVDSSELTAVVDALAAFSEAGYEAGFVVYDFTTERGLGYNADAEYFSASTIKAPFVAYVEQAIIDGGQAALTDPVYEDIVMDGTGIMADDDIDTYDLETVLANTIIHSDNTGYALLRDDYGEGFEAWAAAAGVDARAWEGEWYPYYTPRDLAKLWLNVGGYLRSGGSQSSSFENLLSQTGTSFIRQSLGQNSRVLAKAGYEIDTPFYDMGALNDAGIVQSSSGDYLVAVMSDADYDDEYFTDTEPLITNLIAALGEAHDRLLAA